MRGFRAMVEVVGEDWFMGRTVEGGAETGVAGGGEKAAAPVAWPLSVRLSMERCTPSVCEEALSDVRTLSVVGCLQVLCSA